MSASEESQRPTPTQSGEVGSRGHRLPGLRRKSAASASETSGSTVAETTAVPSRPTHDDDATRQVSQRKPVDMVGRFELISRIGEGGMGVVYRAIDTQDPQRREVAVKVLREHIAYDAEARKRLAREVTTLERVQHRNIAAVIDADPMGKRPYIATEYVPGEPLHDIIDRNGPLSPDELADLGHDLASAIDAIHAAGVVHRDIKPSNVLMVGSTPVLIDFGIAHIADDSRLTSTGLVMGTPGYLSPEVVEGAPVSRSTDWWGWAATLAYAAQGEPPFGRGAMAAVLDRVTRGQANLSGVDKRLRPLLAAALSPVPSERPSAREVLDQMNRYARGEMTTGVPVRSGGAGGTAAMPVVDATRVAPVIPPSATRQMPAPAPRLDVSPQQGLPQQGRAQTSAPQPRDSFLHGGNPQRGYGQIGGNSPYPSAGQVSAHPDGGSRRTTSPYAAPRPQTHPGEDDPRLRLPLRSGTLQALFFLWVAFTALMPVLGLTVLVLWNIAARFTDFTVTQAVMRRYEAGRRKSDSAVAVASSPWHLLRAVVTTVFALILPLFVAICVAAIVGIGYAAVTGGVPRALWALPMIFAALIGQWAMWRGASSTSYRRGSRSLARVIVPNNGAKRIVIAAMVALGCIMLLGSYLQGGDLSLLPLSGGMVDPLSKYMPN